jgi:hypothetical protein
MKSQMLMVPTHDDLVKMAERWLKTTRGCGVVVTELVTHTEEIPDALGFRSNHSILVECKTSHADFIADQKKHFRHSPKHLGNLRYYLAPEGVIKVEEVSDGWGLLMITPRGMHIVKDSQADMNPQVKVAESFLLYSLVRRAVKRGYLESLVKPLADD